MPIKGGRKCHWMKNIVSRDYDSGRTNERFTIDLAAS